MGQNKQEPVDALDRIKSDVESVKKSLIKSNDPTPMMLQKVMYGDILPLLGALVEAFAERDGDLDERVSDLENNLGEALDAVVGTQQAKLVDILKRTVVLAEEVRGLAFAPTEDMKTRAQVLSAFATEALAALEVESDDEDDSDENGDANTGGSDDLPPLDGENDGGTH